MKKTLVKDSACWQIIIFGNNAVTQDSMVIVPVQEQADENTAMITLVQ